MSKVPFSVQTSRGTFFKNRVSFQVVNSKYMRRIFEKHPPEMRYRFKQVKGKFHKHPYFFFSQFKQVKGIFFNHRFWVSKSHPFVLISEEQKLWDKFKIGKQLSSRKVCSKHFALKGSQSK